MNNNQLKKTYRFILASLLFLTVAFTGCEGMNGNNSDNTSGTYTEKISNLTYTTNLDTITFKWTNPSSKEFSGVRIYQGNTIIQTLEKDKSEYTINHLNFDTSYTFSFAAYTTDADGTEVESTNKVTTTIQT